MLPPIDDDVLRNNPDFERVYKKVTGGLLNPDGSTRDDEATARKREAVRQELREHRLKAIKRQLLLHAVRTAVPVDSPEPTLSEQDTTTSTAPPQNSRPTLPQRRARSSSLVAATNNASTQHQQPQVQTQPAAALPKELIDILLLLPPLLTHAPTLPPETLAALLTTAPLASLPAHLPQLLAQVSATLTAHATAVARSLHPQTNSSYIHRTIPSIPSTTTALVAGAAAQRQALSEARRGAAAAVRGYLDAGARAAAAQLRALEAKHGAAARSTALRAERAALDARAWALAARALRADATARLYAPDARGALANYRRHLGGARLRLLDAVADREARLAEYCDVSPDVVRGWLDEEEEEGGGGGGDGYGPRYRGGDEDDDEQGEHGMTAKEKTLREIARVYREMEGRVGEVRADLERLGVRC